MSGQVVRAYSNTGINDTLESRTSLTSLEHIMELLCCERNNRGMGTAGGTFLVLVMTMLSRSEGSAVRC